MISIEQLIINGIDYSENAVIPLQTQKTLNESLDLGYIEIHGIDREKPFTPIDNVYLKIKDNYGNIKDSYLIIESDTPTEIIKNKKYNHNVLFIEETKWSERFFVEKSFTQPFIHDYFKGAISYTYNNATLDSYSESSKITSETLFKSIRISQFESPMKIGTIVKVEKQPFDFFGLFKWSSGILTITNPQNVTEEIKIKDNDGYINIVFSELGQYTLTFHYIYTSQTGGAQYFEFHFDVQIISGIGKKSINNIKDVINALLITTETLRQSELPRFKLAELIDEWYLDKSPEYLERVTKILNEKSPEFYFSKMSLFEALKTIGDHAHFIPRIRNRKIYLDLLGLDENAEFNSEDYYSYTSTQSSNDFCTKLDSQVNNLVNLNSDSQGSVTTPFNDGYRTLRTESGTVQIKDENIIIPTESPIEKIIKLEIGYVEGIDEPVGDITPYVYESSEYKALSSYSKNYPEAKMYALEYTIGSPHIKGLSFKREEATDYGLENIAIKNIINRKINGGLNIWNKIFDSKDAFKFQYRLTYIPNTTTRVTQVKAYKDNIKKMVSIAYNQSASKVSSNAYGENLKGQILKLGNIEKTKMYVFPSLDMIPECGKKFDDDYYISVVKCEYYPNFVKCELGLSKDYNNKSAYVEINSQLRFYEISDEIAYNVYRVYEDYCEIGYDNETDNLSLITNAGLDKFLNAFKFGHNGYKDTNVTMVKAKSLNENNEQIADVVLPVVSLGLGNSIMIEYHYEDNYSAGNTAQYESKVRVQTMMRYTDERGEVDKISLQYGKNTTIPSNYAEAVEMGDNLPDSDVVTSMETYFDTLDNPIILKKDNRESIHFTYQTHFVSNNNNIVIGSGLGRYSPFVTNETLNYRLVLLKNKINKFDNEIDLTNSYHYDSIIVNEPDYENKKIKLSNVVAPLDDETWKSWAIVQTIKNEENEITKAILILGENKDIKSGDIIEMPNFVFKHKIVED